jgi:hypothetical protein
MKVVYTLFILFIAKISVASPVTQCQSLGGMYSCSSVDSSKNVLGYNYYDFNTQNQIIYDHETQQSYNYRIDGQGNGSLGTIVILDNEGFPIRFVDRDSLFSALNVMSSMNSNDIQQQISSPNYKSNSQASEGQSSLNWNSLGRSFANALVAIHHEYKAANANSNQVSDSIKVARSNAQTIINKNNEFLAKAKNSVSSFKSQNQELNSKINEKVLSKITGISNAGFEGSDRADSSSNLDSISSDLKALDNAFSDTPQMSTKVIQTLTKRLTDEGSKECNDAEILSKRDKALSHAREYLSNEGFQNSEIIKNLLDDAYVLNLACTDKISKEDIEAIVLDKFEDFEQQVKDNIIKQNLLKFKEENGGLTDKERDFKGSSDNFEDLSQQFIKEGNIESAVAASKLSSSFLDLALGVTPYVGTAKDFQEAVTGKKLITGESLGIGERSLSMAFVTLDLFSVGVGGRAVKGAISASRKFYKNLAILNIFNSSKSILKSSEEVVKSISAKGLEYFTNSKEQLINYYKLLKNNKKLGKIDDLDDVIATAKRTTDNQIPILFDGDLAVSHFEKHSGQIMKYLGKSSYNMKEYMVDANFVIKNGSFAPELNGYVKIIGSGGSSGNAQAAFVGLKNTGKNISTFHIKSVKEIARKAPSLGWEI